MYCSWSGEVPLWDKDVGQGFALWLPPAQMLGSRFSWAQFAGGTAHWPYSVSKPLLLPVLKESHQTKSLWDFVGVRDQNLFEIMRS